MRMTGSIFPTAAVIGALCLASFTASHSAIIYSGLRNVSNPAPSTQGDQSLPVDLDDRGGPDIALVSQTGSFYSPPSSGPSHLGIGDGMWHYPGGYFTAYYTSLSFSPSVDFVAGRSPGYTQGMGPVLDIIGVDTVIGPDSVFSLRSDTRLAASISSTGGLSGYFGFRFNPTGGQTLYGWGRIVSNSSLSMAQGGNITLTDWAYDDSGAPIAAGQIPEPTGSSCLVLAGLAAAGRRRRLRPEALQAARVHS